MFKSVSILQLFWVKGYQATVGCVLENLDGCDTCLKELKVSHRTML